MATVTKICPDCGTAFEADAPWKKTCLDCWIERKEKTGERRVQQLEEQLTYWRNLAQGDKAGEVNRLAKRCEDLTSALAGARMKIKHLEGELLIAQARSYTPPPRPAAAGIPADMLRRLIQLVHPDKHDGKESAVVATRWLLEQRP